MNRNKRLVIISVIVLMLVAAAAILLPRAMLAQLELIFMPPTALEVTRTNLGDSALEPPKQFPMSTAAQTLYYVMRTRGDGNYAGGCRITSGLAGTGASNASAAHYHIRFLRGTAPLLDANLVPECNRFFLTKQDAWYPLPFTYQDSYFRGAFQADATFVSVFKAVTQLAYPPK